VAGGEELLGQIEPLWRKLNNHHLPNSVHFKEKYMGFTFQGRRKYLEEKAAHGEILVLLAKCRDGDRYVGYCVGSITNEGIGEIDFIFVEHSYRKLGLGDSLMERSLDWLESKNPNEIMLNVAGGNEKALGFYQNMASRFIPQSWSKPTAQEAGRCCRIQITSSAAIKA
jgi:ribosomal protein S18 acetylase RimI-like enzyme